MTIIRTLQDAQTQKWDLYVNKKQASIYHLAKWRDVISEVFGHQSFYLEAINEKDEVVGVLPLVRLKSMLFGNYIVSMPYFNYGGVVADSTEIENALLSKAEDIRLENGSSHIELRHLNAIGNNLPERTDKVTMLLELPKDPDELWSAIGSKRRAQVKRPIREGAEFKLGGVELLDQFYEVFAQNMRDLGTPVYSKKFFAEILKSFKEEASIALVTLKGKAVGAGFLLTHQKQMEIPWASTLREFNRFGINMFLYWNILKQAIEKGCSTFDFGRSSKDSGTLKFKKQWGAEEKQLHWHYILGEGEDIPVLNHSNKKYELLINTWKKMPVSLCNIIGPHVVKGLP